MRDFDYDTDGADVVSVLFNEPKLLKSLKSSGCWQRDTGFSALQRAEIAEIRRRFGTRSSTISSFSALQRAEIAEIQRRVGRAGAGA